MSDDVPSILSHVSIGTNDLERAASFYDKVLPTLGCKRVMEHPGGIAYGKLYPEFWLQVPVDGRQAREGPVLRDRAATAQRIELDLRDEHGMVEAGLDLGV